MVWLQEWLFPLPWHTQERLPRKEKKVEKVIITVLDYDSERYEEKEFESIEECFPYKDSPSVTWINIDGIHQVEMMEKIGTHFGIHPLVMEDILNIIISRFLRR